MKNGIHHRSFFLQLGLAGALMGQPVAWAQGLPPLQTVGAVSYLNGGIGLDESNALKAEGSKWPLTLVFSF